MDFNTLADGLNTHTTSSKNKVKLDQVYLIRTVKFVKFTHKF